jgi:hypothetical protein
MPAPGHTGEPAQVEPRRGPSGAGTSAPVRAGERQVERRWS